VSDQLNFAYSSSRISHVFFFNATATTEIYTLSLHDALPIWALAVLVAEDNELNATLTRMMVERAGHVPHMVESGVEALAALEDAAPGTYDLVFMDLHMPLMDGYEATRQIRKLGPAKGALPIVARTANVMAEDKKACLEAGMDDYLAKPVDPSDLAAMLESWRGKKSDKAA